MIDRNLAQGLCLAAIALAFGLSSLLYPIGTLKRAGPGLFPLIVSSALLVIALLSIARSRFVERQPFEFRLKNIVIILLSLSAFVGVSKFINMTVGIAVMVFMSSLAASTYSWRRNLKISVVLIAVAFAFQRFFGLNLPLY
ncbi:MAG: tripartite tricarboxylate transporter TctB family protein [Zoogloeaceae bacterium]|jgi:hypothetical protein|nr:tripartite tricarboxylate transporter TctB family protein [Zoogloeaceae bacterium]